MQLYHMDFELIEIYQLHNLESVQLWDLTQINSDKMTIIPALLVVYDGGKYLNISAKDPHFPIFAKKVVEVYNDEKNNILEDGLTDPFHLRPNIDIDEHTKAVLESGELTAINEIYRFYENKASYNGTLLFEIDEVKSLLPIIKYHLEKFYKSTNHTVVFQGDVNGYRSVYNIEATVDGVATTIPLVFNKDSENDYTILVGGINTKPTPYELHISFKNTAIEVAMAIPLYNVTCYATYELTQGAPKMTYRVYKDGAIIIYENQDLPTANNQWSNLADLDYDSHLSWYSLPWHALYGVENTITDISPTEKTVAVHSMYLETLPSAFKRREFYSQTYHRNKTATLDAQAMCLDEVSKNISGVCLSTELGVYAIETRFTETPQESSGYYQEQLKNRYFYHLVQTPNGLKGITRAALKSISQTDNVLGASDLLNKTKILELVKGE